MRLLAVTVMALVVIALNLPKQIGLGGYGTSAGEPFEFAYWHYGEFQGLHLTNLALDLGAGVMLLAGVWFLFRKNNNAVNADGSGEA